MSSADCANRLYIEFHGKFWGLSQIYDHHNNLDAPAEEQILEWIELGEVMKLEQLVLDGRSHMLREKSTHNLASKEFLKTILQYQVNTAMRFNEMTEFSQKSMQFIRLSKREMFVG